MIEQFGKSTVRGLDKPINAQCGSTHNGLITSEAYQAFIGYYYGNACDSHITDPLGTCTTKDRHYLVTSQANKKIEVEDCYYRMIRSKEVGAAMAFENNYIVLGDERQKVKQYGNAVTPPVMKYIIKQCVESLK
jgi:DNA (cytosine-5)-methyltransferase 1